MSSKGAMFFSLGLKRPHDIPPSPPPVTKRPPVKIGLALGGGSARGWAHIGVISELAAHGIVPDVVAGTSIGAVVGACFVAGKLDQLETFALSLNRRRILALMDLSFNGTGLIRGRRLRNRLQRELGGLKLEDLPKPFAAIATELGTGREVSLVRGDVVEALQASYALPGIFEPQSTGGRWLFDGCMANPVPVSVCRSLGADFVIAVNLTADLAQSGRPDTDVTVDRSVAELDELAASVASEHSAPGRRMRLRRIFGRRRFFKRRRSRGPGIASVMVGAFSIAQERISRSRLAIDPPDAMVNARLTSVGLFDFHRASELIEHGREVARRCLPDIEAKLTVLGRTPADRVSLS